VDWVELAHMLVAGDDMVEVCALSRALCS